MARFPGFGQIWPDSARFGQIGQIPGPDWPDSGPDWPDSARFGQIGQIPGFRTILARGGPSSGILTPLGGVQIPGGAPNWHKSGGGGISCIRSSGTLSPGTYRSQILADSGTRALGTRILGTFRADSAEMDHFSGTRFWTPQDRILDPPWPDSGPPLARSGPPDWPDSARFGQIRPVWPLLARFRVQIGQIRPDSLKCGVPESWSDP